MALRAPAFWTPATPPNCVRLTDIAFCSEALRLKWRVDAGRSGAGRAKLRLSRGFPRRTRLRRHPLNHSFESTMICAAIGAKIQPLFGRREMIKQSGREFVGLMLLGGA
jgi:hypothetical protein